MITDACPSCGKQHAWDACQDTYNGSNEVILASGYDDENREVTVFYCDCGTAFAMTLKDDNGAVIFVPSTKEL